MISEHVRFSRSIRFDVLSFDPIGVDAQSTQKLHHIIMLGSHVQLYNRLGIIAYLPTPITVIRRSVPPVIITIGRVSPKAS